MALSAREDSLDTARLLKTDHDNETEIATSLTFFESRLVARRRFFILLGLNGLGLVAIFVLLFLQLHHPHEEITNTKTQFYSPADPVAVTEYKRFKAAPNTTYFGQPDEKRNKAWTEICGSIFGVVQLKLNEEEKQILPPTIESPISPGYSVYQLAVCHQLHCLNRIRLSFYPESFPGEKPEDIAFHKDHCIDYIREALMCHSDTTLDYFTHSPELDRAVFRINTVHQCRSFTAVKEWAIANQLRDKKRPNGEKEEFIQGRRK